MTGARRVTRRQRRGQWAEDLVATYLLGLGWQLVARNIRVGRSEVDLLAVDPAQAVVVVEVRGLHSPLFGAPEERVDRHKVSRLYRAAAILRAAGQVDGRRLPALPWRVDLVVVDARDAGRPRLRHVRAVEPP